MTENNNFGVDINDIERWLAHNFPNETRITATLGLTEEAGELARAVLKQHQGIRGSYDEWQAEIAKELGDIFAKAVHVAMICGIDLFLAIHDRWEEVRQRDWIKDPIGHGVPTEVDKTETTRGDE